MLKVYLLVSFFWVSGIIVACGGKSSPAEVFMEEYFEAWKQKDWKKVASLYDAQFYEAKKISAEAWSQQIQKSSSILGELEKWQLLSWTDHLQQGSGTEGKYYILNYAVHYANDEVQESFVIYQSQDGKSIKILNWNPNPKKLTLP
ncbi:MAG: hypothetical protein RML72_07600 [Bacteroidia bacterium]|nr:hypothetical protein [Bacteroidia bacterium]MDW8158724.1 hypothetical protein [Bacteroidia bacterium]